MGTPESKIHDEPLEHYPLRGRYQIRLLRIPGWGYQVQDSYEIKTFTLHNCPPFSALSYAWGTRQGQARIYINDIGTKVTRNLYSFLQAVSVYNRLDRWVWIDALCINQLDLEERSQQVALMKELYEAATDIIIWLGEATEDTSLAFESIRKSGSAYFEQQGAHDQMTRRDRISQSEGKALGDLFSREYWSRAWIIQEATAPVAKSGILCGKYEMSLRLFYAGYLSLTRDTDFLECAQRLGYTINHTISEILKIKETRSVLEHGQGLDLYYLLQLARGQNCTDPRDKIYSIIPISAEADNVARPNYLLPVEEFYMQLALIFIGRNNLDFLGFAGLRRSPSLPSWVPDWRVKDCPCFIPRRKENQKPHLKQEAPIFNAGANTVPLVDYPRIGIRNLHGVALRLTGFVFDTIELVSMPRTQKLGLQNSFFRDWAGVAFGSPNAYRGQLEEAVCQTMTAGKGYSVQDSVKRIVENLDHPNVDVKDEWRSIFSSNVEESLFRALTRTKLGYLALVPEETRAGDSVCIFWGSRIPCILRADGDHWFLVGECYVHAIMEGEAWIGFDLEIRTIIPSQWNLVLDREREELKVKLLKANDRIRDFDIW